MCLHDKGLIYRGNYLVNWAPKLQTAVSDLEVCFALPLHLHKSTDTISLPMHLHNAAISVSIPLLSHTPAVTVSLHCKMVNKHTDSICQLTLKHTIRGKRRLSLLPSEVLN